MVTPSHHKNEEERLKDLRSYSILDTLPEEHYDNLTAIAAGICDVPIALISFIDEKRQWFKSKYGINKTETPREHSFCAHAINTDGELFIIPDTTEDQRFHDHPLVVEAPRIRFYAGVPLLSNRKLPLGTLCVMDNRAKQLDEDQKRSLKALASQVVKLMELGKHKKALKKANEQLRKKNEELEKFAHVAAHDLKSPLNNIRQLIDLCLNQYGGDLNADARELIELAGEAALNLRNLIDGLMEHSKSDEVSIEETTHIDMDDLQEEIDSLLNFDNDYTIRYHTELETIETNQTALKRILINLISNAIKYNNKEQPEIDIRIEDTGDHYKFSVADNGPGIDPEDQDKIFQLFEVLDSEDELGNKSNGIGLTTVKKTVEALDGTIQVDSKKDKGTVFTFTISK